MIVARSRARVAALVLASGVCVWICIKVLFRVVGGVGVVVYICIYVYNALVACVVVFSLRVYG